MKENKILTVLVRSAALVIALLIFVTLSGCDIIGQLGLVTTDTTDTEDTPGPGVITTKPAGDDTTVGTDVTTDKPDDSGVITDEVTTAPDETTDDSQLIKYVDPLTGLEFTVDYSGVRPVSLVFDNLSAAAPQSGISNCDVLIECMVESGISRLIGITNKYMDSSEQGDLEAYGPIRSTRPYMVSLSQAFNTLMVGAGYSDQGYALIKELGVDYINGTHDRYALQGFYRDAERFKNNGYEHSLMISGKGIVKLAGLNNFAIAQPTPSAFNFSDSVTLNGAAASHVVLKYSAYQQVQLVYSATSGTYYRYQFGDEPHLDAENGEQLNFTNVLILFAPTKIIAGDTEGRLDVGVTGSGKGYYITGGRSTEINWTRADDTSSFIFTTPGGGQLEVNKGKTFITVVNEALKDTAAITLDYRVGG